MKILVEQWFEHYGAPKKLHCDEDVRIRGDAGLYKTVFGGVNIQVTTGVLYANTSNPLSERQTRVVRQNVRIVMKQEDTNFWVRFLPRALLTLNSQQISSNSYAPHESSHGGRPMWSFKTPFLGHHKSPAGDSLEHKQDLATWQELTSSTFMNVR